MNVTLEELLTQAAPTARVLRLNCGSSMNWHDSAVVRTALLPHPSNELRLLDDMYHTTMHTHCCCRSECCKRLEWHAVTRRAAAVSICKATVQQAITCYTWWGYFSSWPELRAHVGLHSVFYCFTNVDQMFVLKRDVSLISRTALQRACAATLL